jgi:hypothetical protein
MRFVFFDIFRHVETFVSVRGSDLGMRIRDTVGGRAAFLVLACIGSYSVWVSRIWYGLPGGIYVEPCVWLSVGR